MSNTISLGERIRNYRVKHGLTQSDLAKGLCTPSMVSQIESDRAKPSYKILCGIADRLGVKVEMLLENVDLQLEYLSTYKMARAMIASHEYTAAIPLLLGVLEVPRGQISTTEVLLELGKCYFHSNQSEPALQTFSQVREDALLRQDKRLLAECYQYMGQIEFRRKKYQLAVYHLQKAMEHAETDAFFQGSIFRDLGTAYHKLGEVRKAADALKQASELFGEADNLKAVADTNFQLAKELLRLGDREEAAKYAERATAIYNGLDHTIESERLQVATATLLAKSDPERAVEMLQEAVTKFQTHGQKEDEAAAIVELAIIQNESGQLDQAETSCKAACQVLPAGHVDQGRANLILARIAEKKGNHDEAMLNFQTAADIFQHAGKISERNEALYELSLMYLDDGNATQAYRLLEKVYASTRVMLEHNGIIL